VDQLSSCYEPEEVYEALQRAFPDMTIDDIISEVRR